MHFLGNKFEGKFFEYFENDFDFLGEEFMFSVKLFNYFGTILIVPKRNTFYHPVGLYPFCMSNGTNGFFCCITYCASNLQLSLL